MARANVPPVPRREPLDELPHALVGPQPRIGPPRAHRGVLGGIGAATSLVTMDAESAGASTRPWSSARTIALGYPSHHRFIVVIRASGEHVSSVTSTTTSTMPVYTVSRSETLFTIARQLDEEPSAFNNATGRTHRFRLHAPRCFMRCS